MYMCHNPIKNAFKQIFIKIVFRFKIIKMTINDFIDPLFVLQSQLLIVQWKNNALVSDSL